MTPELAAVLTVLFNVLMGGTIGVITIVVTSRSRRAEKKTETETEITLTDRQQIYKLLGELKATNETNTKEIDRLRDIVDRLNSQVGRSNAEIVRLNAIIVWYRTQLEINHITIAPLPKELMPKEFGQFENAVAPVDQ